MLNPRKSPTCFVGATELKLYDLFSCFPSRLNGYCNHVPRSFRLIVGASFRHEWSSPPTLRRFLRSSSTSHRTRPKSAQTGSSGLLLDRRSEDALPEHWKRHLKDLSAGEQRSLRRYFPALRRINALEPMMQAYSDEELQLRAENLRSRARAGWNLDDLLPEAFALVREACWRVLGLRHYDVQLLGGIVLAEGQVAEMRTGEGKTLVAVLPAFLYSLSGKGVHIVTVNDYLAQRDASWVGKSLQFLGLDVGVVTSTCSDLERRAGFAADVTYVTAYALAFTFLYDHMTPSGTSVSIRRPLHFAIVDEVDSILIDEARNPFIINAPYDVGIDEAPTWRAAVDIARMLRPPPSFHGPPPENASTGIVWFEDATSGSPIVNQFDFLMDKSLMSANLTQIGMSTVVHVLMDLGLVHLATCCVPAEDNGNDNAGDVESIFVILLSTLDDGRIQATVRHVHEPGLGVDYAPPTRGRICSMPWTVQGDNENDVVIHDVSNLEETIGELFGLRILPRAHVTQLQLQAAAPAVLWTGAVSWGNYITQALRAEWLYQRNVHYLVKNGKITIIDIASGREKESSRWQSGLHQAVEAKEQRYDGSVKISLPSYDRQRTTFQSLFNCYQRLSGMTGTASIESAEFEESYGLQVVRVPPHRPSRRVDIPNEIYPSRLGWSWRIQDLVREAIATSRPLLLAASSVEDSEIVRNLVHRALKAKEEAFASFGETELQDVQRALKVLPAELPSPDVKSIRSEAYENGKFESLLEFYEQFRGAYGTALDVLRHIATVGRPPHPGAELMDDVSGALALARSTGLLDSREEHALQMLIDLLHAKSMAGQRHPERRINVLNARPEAIRREAEIIAQAGLPGTITVATAVAGRGTDILLGGNPKGLVLLTLRHFFLPCLAPQANDLSEWRFEPPLAGMPEGQAFRSPRDMNRHMPRALVEVFEVALKASQDMGGMENTEKFSSAGYVSSALEMLVEESEMDRSHFLLAVSRGEHVRSLDAALAWLRSTMGRAQHDDEGILPSSISTKLREYSLLQWLWFDDQCREYGRRVRGSGGLQVVVTSLQESRRVLQQLRGRAGRQGDPGETVLVSSLEDELLQFPSFASLLNLIKSALPEDVQLEPLDAGSIDRLVTQAEEMIEQIHRQGRDSTRKYDAVLESYRRHVYRLRRIVVAGGEAARAVLLHVYCYEMASELVSIHANASLNPQHWGLKNLVKTIELLMMNPQNSSSMKHDQLDGPAETKGTSDITFTVTDKQNSIQADPVQVVNSCVHDDGTFLSFEAALGGIKTETDLVNALTKNTPLPALFDPVHNVPPFRRTAWQNVSRFASDGLLNASSYGDGWKGPYAWHMRRLASWVSNLLQSLLEERRRKLLAAGSATLGNELQRVGSLRLVERNNLLTVLDGLWADFLHDASTLERATATRAFSLFDPVDEFRLEAAQLFAQMLTNFRRQAVVVALGSVLRDEWEAYAVFKDELHESVSDLETLRENGGRASFKSFSSDEISWAIDWMNELRARRSSGDLRKSHERKDGTAGSDWKEYRGRNSSADVKSGGGQDEPAGDDDSIRSSGVNDELLWNLTNAIIKSSEEDVSTLIRKMQSDIKDRE